MAATGLRIQILCTVVALSAAVTWAAQSAPAVDCSSLVLNMADCLSFVIAGSTTKKPEGTCCSGMKTVLKTDAECPCEAFRNSAAQLGVTLNVSKAVTLPSACHVSAASVSNCGLSISTGAAAPALSPTLAVSLSSVAGAQVAPAPAPCSSSTSSLTASIVLLVAGALSFAPF